MLCSNQNDGGRKASTRLKLINAIKAAKSPSPCFLFLLQYPSDTNDPIIYGRHVWEDDVSRWLRRARETETDGQSDLHGLSVSLNFSKTEIIIANPVDWILEVLSRYGGEDYSSNKRNLVRSAGYGETVAEASVTVGPLSGTSDVVLHELGYIESLPISELRMFDVRFGIRAGHPSLELSSGRLSFTQEGRPLTVELVGESGATFTIPALAWTSSIVGFDHPDFRVRVKAGHIDILVDPKGADDKITISYDLETPLGSWSSSGSSA